MWVYLLLRANLVVRLAQFFYMSPAVCPHLADPAYKLPYFICDTHGPTRNPGKLTTSTLRILQEYVNFLYMRNLQLQCTCTYGATHFPYIPDIMREWPVSDPATFYMRYTATQHNATTTKCTATQHNTTQCNTLDLVGWVVECIQCVRGVLVV